MRKDLQLVEGLAISQGFHIGMLHLQKDHDPEKKSILLDKLQNDWVPDPYVSVLAVHCYEDLIMVKEHAEREKLRVHVWEDTIPSPTLENQAIKAIIGLCIGPDDFDKIKIVTNGLPLYS
jgi:peptidyl-tRNA hydrolase